jgi:hypothetical protein
MPLPATIIASLGWPYRDTSREIKDYDIATLEEVVHIVKAR